MKKKISGPVSAKPIEMTDEQLSQELHKSKGGRAGGTLLSLFGGIVIVCGMILGGNMAVIIAGAVLLGLGQMAKGKARDKANQQAFDTIVPEIAGNVFTNIQMNPVPHLLDMKDTNIPLPSHNYCSGSGYVRGTYQGLTAELCTMKLTDVDEFQREETGLWEKKEREVYTGQWMLCELGQEFPTWLTIWPRDKMDKLFNTRTIKTGNEAFDKRFNLNSDDAKKALRILNSSRMEQFLALADSVGGKLAINLNRDGKLYIAVHSGYGFFDTGKGHESPIQLRQRFTAELGVFTNLIDLFRSM